MRKDANRQRRWPTAEILRRAMFVDVVRPDCRSERRVRERGFWRWEAFVYGAWRRTHASARLRAD